MSIGLSSRVKTHTPARTYRARAMNAKTRRPLIAVVDDDVYVCRALKRLVWTHGIKAETFSSGNDFIGMLEAVPSLQLDCVVLDMDMPGLDGLQVQARLEAIRPRTPVI